VVCFGLGFWLARLKRAAEQPPPPIAADLHPVAPPVAGSLERVTLFLASDDEGVLLPRTLEIPVSAEAGERAKQILQALLAAYAGPDSRHHLPAGADINDVYLVNKNMAVVDTNTQFADAHPSGILLEELTVASLVETIGANVPGITQVKILVGGKERETLAGHADLTGFYDVSALKPLVNHPNEPTPGSSGTPKEVPQ
jgi:hypothetical protein